MHEQPHGHGRRNESDNRVPKPEQVVASGEEFMLHQTRNVLTRRTKMCEHAAALRYRQEQQEQEDRERAQLEERKSVVRASPDIY
jgi:hypothetical protein